jgi:glycosyltransferase involved in cell wall biosynthesis
MIQKMIIIELYYSLFKKNTFSKLLQKKGYEVEQFAFFKTENKRFINKWTYIVREIICLLKVIFKLHSFRNNRVFCLGGYYATLLVCRLFYPFLGKNFHIFIYNFYLHETGEKKLIQAILRFLLNNPKCTLIVQSPKEVDFYKRLTSIPVEFVPYCADIIPIKESYTFDFQPGSYIFTGGYTNRDYSLVLQCANAFPDQLFVIVASHLNTDFKENIIPQNVMLFKNLPNTDFETLLAHAKIVLIPLKSDVGASGQMLCLSAMQHKKPIIYTDISSINYYFEDHVSGISYPLGVEKTLVKELGELINNPKLQETLGQNAYNLYMNNFTSAHRDIKLLEVINA